MFAKLIELKININWNLHHPCNTQTTSHVVVPVVPLFLQEHLFHMIARKPFVEQSPGSYMVGGSAVGGIVKRRETERVSRALNRSHPSHPPD